MHSLACAVQIIPHVLLLRYALPSLQRGEAVCYSSIGCWVYAAGGCFPLSFGIPPQAYVKVNLPSKRTEHHLA